ncbi:hypothetical protein C7C46_15920 [Streptomyces tateyamensis]|uniref:LPXTG cell wall anchor domain-containing protein n=1 Tax=Streptomyces tateyamensis TaxID=565073 RepID=A0A2V4N6H1_9ACTN|nr:hypothetical protein [Streptomyces tateyamensis]PYC78589.1 hypothetical protein C7C46_15920 [Streptomyces tateyamensis]
MSQWNSDRLQLGGLTRGDHVLHETLSVPDGNPAGSYELIVEMLMDGCNRVSGTKDGPVTVWFGAVPGKAPAGAPTGGGTTGGTATRKASASATRPSPNTDSPSPSPSDSPSPSAGASPSDSPTPSPSASPSAVASPTEPASPAAVPLAASPAAHSGSALPWMLGALAAVAVLVAGGVLVWRRRREVAPEPAAAETAVLPVVPAEPESPQEPESEPKPEPKTD